ncbi:MAG: hypothetical protein WD278_01225 [Pirellulales bacterium]
MKFSMLSLLGAVAFVALACAALLNASPLTESCAFSVTVAVFVTSTLVILVCRGRYQACAIGFTLFGLAYLTVVWKAEGSLVTGRILDAAHSAVPWPDVSATIEIPERHGAFGRSVLEYAREPVEDAAHQEARRSVRMTLAEVHGRTRQRAFVAIGHYLCSAAFALVGGVLARWLYTKRVCQ